jgi:hypothetical protein
LVDLLDHYLQRQGLVRARSCPDRLKEAGDAATFGRRHEELLLRPIFVLPRGDVTMTHGAQRSQVVDVTLPAAVRHSDDVINIPELTKTKQE